MMSRKIKIFSGIFFVFLFAFVVSVRGESVKESESVIFSKFDARLNGYLVGSDELSESRLGGTQLFFPTTEFSALVEMKKGYSLPRIKGLRIYSRLGSLYSVRGTREAFRRLAHLPSLKRAEAPRMFRRKRYLSSASLITHVGRLDRGKSSYTYRFHARASGKLEIRLYPSFDKDDDSPLFFPKLTICRDLACRKVIDSDLTDLGEMLSGIPKDPHPKPISHAKVSLSVTSSSDLYIRVESLTKSENKRFLLMLSSHDMTLLSSDLTGGNLAAQKARVLGVDASSLWRKGLSGKGVLIGIIDTGIDWCHKDFRDRKGRSRIVALWDQNLTPKGQEKSPDIGDDHSSQNDYGVLYTQTMLNKAVQGCQRQLVRSSDEEGHGSHIAGIAAGGGVFQGVAPEADLLVVKLKSKRSKFSESTYLFDAIAFMVSQAKKRHQPLVINLSQGGHDGPADGTSLIDRAVIAASGPGRIVVVSAGNEGLLPIHASGEIAQGQRTTLTFTFEKMALGEVRIYTELEDRYDFVLEAPSGAQLSAKWGDDTNFQPLGEGKVRIIAGRGKHKKVKETLLAFFPHPIDKTIKWKLHITRRGGSGKGHFDAYMVIDYGPARFLDHVFRNKDSSYRGTLGELASSPGAFTVASYQIRHVLDTKSLDDYIPLYPFIEPGAISAFSSRGPTRDGRSKPDISAPGDLIVSTKTGTCQSLALCDDEDQTTPDGMMIALQGTSFAVPFVVGAAALILQKYPSAFPRPLLKLSALATISDKNAAGVGLLRVTHLLEKIQRAVQPTISLQADQLKGQAPLTLTITVKNRSQAILAEFHWDLDGDGVTDVMTTAPRYSLTLSKVGSHQLHVTVVSQKGRTAQASVTIQVLNSGSSSEKNASQESHLEIPSEKISEPISLEKVILPDAGGPDRFHLPEKNGETLQKDASSSKGCSCSQRELPLGGGFFLLFFVALFSFFFSPRKK